VNSPQYCDKDWLAVPDINRAIAQSLQFQLSQSQLFSRQKMLDQQYLHLNKLLQHCLDSVPFYQNSGYHPIEHWDDWYRLPILSRQEVQENFHQLRSTLDLVTHEGRSMHIKSSGSTGRPIEVVVSERSQLHWQALTVRDHLWNKRDFTKKLAVIKYLGTENGMSGIAAKQWGPATACMYNTGPSYALNSSCDIQSQYKWLETLQAEYLIVYPSLLQALVKLNQRSTKKISFENITTIGETLNNDVRVHAEATFGCKVSDIYSCQELGYIALKCPHGDHYHVQSESVFVEILDHNGVQCSPGEMGRVVVTALHNKVMPLIRYDIGDYAVVGEDCNCPILLPTLEKIVGRTRNLVRYPDGRVSWPSYNPMALMDILPNAQFQLIQETIDTLIFRVTSSDVIDETLFERVRSVINTAIGYEFNIVFEQCDTISRSKSGKFEEFYSRLAHV